MAKIRKNQFEFLNIDRIHDHLYSQTLKQKPIENKTQKQKQMYYERANGPYGWDSRIDGPFEPKPHNYEPKKGEYYAKIKHDDEYEEGDNNEDNIDICIYDFPIISLQ